MNSTTIESLENDLFYLMDAFDALTKTQMRNIAYVRQLRHFVGRLLVEYVDLGGTLYQPEMSELFTRLIYLEYEIAVDSTKELAETNRRTAHRHKPGLTTRDPLLLAQFSRLRSGRKDTLSPESLTHIRELTAVAEKEDSHRIKIPRCAAELALHTNDPILTNAFERLRKLK